MSYKNSDGCGGCLDFILFVIFVFFVAFIFLKGCSSCADGIYKNYKKWHENSSNKEQKYNYYIPQKQDTYDKRKEYYPQSKSIQSKERVATYQKICPVCEGKGVGRFCNVCNGKGTIRSKCLSCGGTGRNSYLRPDGDKLVPESGPCNECNGTGFSESMCPKCSPLDKCSRCNGSGWITVSEIANY